MFGRRDVKNVENNLKVEDKPNIVEKYGNVVGEMLRIQDILGFFKYDINPSYLDAKVEAAIAKEQRGSRQVPFAWALFFIMLIIGGAIGFMIINGQLQSNTCQQQLANCLTTGGKIVSSASQTIEAGSAGIGLR